VSFPPPLDESTLNVAVAYLTRNDDALDRIVSACGPPPLWERVPGFRTLSNIILGQHVSLASAASLFSRLDRDLPGGITLESVCEAGVGGLQTLGLTRQKARYLHALADMTSSGKVPLDDLETMSDSEVSELLMLVPGVGPWTVGIYLLMALRRPDVWPSGDLALHRMIEHLAGSDSRLGKELVDAYAERWRPYRAVAARILWQGYLSGFHNKS
jgi:DNA-3-methyladenine glycosylase II